MVKVILLIFILSSPTLSSYRFTTILSYHLKQNLKKKPSEQRLKNTNLKVVEHLIDCVNNPEIAEVYGGLQSEYCLQPNGGWLNGIGGLFNQMITIGFLLASYYIFKSSDLWTDGKESVSSTKSNSNQSKRRQCPQCNGAGYTRWNSKIEVCDICEGAGSIKFSPRKSFPALPGSTKSTSSSTSTYTSKRVPNDQFTDTDDY
eukprot:gene8540-17614_t